MAKELNDQIVKLMERKSKLQRDRDAAIMNGNSARANTLFPKIQTLILKIRELRNKQSD